MVGIDALDAPIATVKGCVCTLCCFSGYYLEASIEGRLMHGSLAFFHSGCFLYFILTFCDIVFS